MADDNIIIRDNEGTDPPFAGPWDIVWNNDPNTPLAGTGDWAIADPTIEITNAGGFQARNPLGTAIILCLFCDARRPDWMQGDAGTNPRGWHGDTFDIQSTAHETDLGSLIWTLERAPLTDDTASKLKQFAAAALQTLIDQGVVYAFDIEVQMDKVNGLISIEVAGYNRTGQNIFENSYPFIQR